MNHLVITRLNFEDDELFYHYFEVMKQTYIPSIRNQKNQNFKIAFNVNPKHLDIVKPHFQDNALYFHNFDQIKNYCVENNVQIQTRHDCDDWMREDYIEKIQEIFSQKINDMDKFIIHSKVHKMNFETGEIFEHGTSYENNNFISMFLTLCQKTPDNFVYDKNHRFMGEITKNIFLLNEGHTRLVIHGKNILSKINHTDKPLQTPKIELSIITPTFKNVEYIDEFLDSILNAKKNYNVETLIGIDNCEETKNYISKNYNKFKDKYKFYFFDKNVGPYVIRNTLSEISKSNKLLFVDSDDIISENLIKEVIDNLNSFEVVRFKFYNFKRKQDLNEIKKENINSFSSIGQFGILKTKFMELNGYEPWICGADSEFKMREESNQYKVKNIPNILYFRRRHNNSLTSNEETNFNSSIRKKYVEITKEKKRKKQTGKLNKLSVNKVYEIKEGGRLKDIGLKTNWSIIDRQKQQKNEIIEELVLKKNHHQNTPIRVTLEKTNKQIDYSKVNEIFNNRNLQSFNPQVSNKVQTNSSFINKMQKTNKKRR
jgi:hypothetical protein